MSDGGYLLPEGSAEAFEWMKKNGIVRIVRELKLDTKTWEKVSDIFRYYRADGTEYKDEYSNVQESTCHTPD
jgi:hypothetical protein